MPEFDTGAFARSLAGQLLRRIAESDPGGAPLQSLGLGVGDTAPLLELERLGYVQLGRGAGAMSWRIERVTVSDAGRARAGKDSG